MSETLAGKVAVVTGAGGNLCSVVARDLARQGAMVALIGRTREKLEIVAGEIEHQRGTALICPADVTDEHGVLAAGEAVASSLGQCSILINGAGGNSKNAVTTQDRFSEEELAETPGDIRGFFNISSAEFSRIVVLNTTGTMIPCQIFGKQMAQTGGGAIVNMASMNSYTPLTRNSAYAAGKAGVENFTRWLASYLAPANIRVNGIAPGFFPKPGIDGILCDRNGNLTARGEKVVNNTPQRRFGFAAELLGTMNWLIDDNASGFVTGLTVPVDGGFVASSPV